MIVYRYATNDNGKEGYYRLMQDPIYLDVFGDPPIRLDNYNLKT
jgi:hypothetical protein